MRSLARMGPNVGVIGPIIGHRGAAGHAPENTLAGFRKAADLGVRWVEFDVRLSRDGRPILFHDDRLDRTTNAEGRVADWDLDSLKELDAGAWFGPAFAGEPIPTLEAAIPALADLGLGANVEIKPDSDRQRATGAVVADVLAERWPASMPPPLISSFSEIALNAAKSRTPHLRSAYLAKSIPRDWRKRLVALDCADLHVSASKVRVDTIAQLRAAGVSVRCYTVNAESLARRLLSSGVEAVFTDFPDRLMSEVGTSDP